MRKIVACLAAAGMAVAPIAASAQDAGALSLSRASAPMMDGYSFLQDEDDDDNGSTAVIIGVVLIVLLGAAAISGNGDPVDNSPSSP